MGKKSCQDCADREKLSSTGSTCSDCVERINGVYQLTHKNWKPRPEVEKIRQREYAESVCNVAYARAHRPEVEKK
jgi:ribosomal protein L34E